MKNKIAAFCTGIMLLFVPSVLAEEITPLDYESVVFYNSANEEIKEIGNNTSVTAKVNLDSAKTGYVLAAQYNENGRMLSGINVEKFTDTADVAAFDMTVDTTNADTVKVFAFEGLTSPEPILSTPGILKTNVVFEKAFPNTDTYLYRVGTEGAVALGKLFKATGTVGDNVTATIKPIDGNVTVKTTDGNLTSKTINGNVIYKYSAASDWTQSTLDFDGTGIVEVTITDYESTPVTLYIEIVKANNITANADGVYTNWNSSGNNVLLEDVKISDGGSTSLSGSTLYGNGFTFDVSNGKYTGKIISSNYLLYINNSILDNVKLVGAVYKEYGASASANYNNAVILSDGNSKIINSYISNCSAPVRVREGNLNIINSTLKGGNFANLDIRGGNVVLEDVTTINQLSANDTATDGTEVMGFGIVFYEASTSSKLTINGSFNQYNYISKNDISKLPSSDAQTLANLMFGSNYTNYQYTDTNGVKWVNTGIISLTDGVDMDNINDNRESHSYIEKSASFSTYKGYVYSKSASAPVSAPLYETQEQGIIAPSIDFNHNKNFQAQTTDSDEHCYYSEDIDAVLISFGYNSSKVYDPNILVTEKCNDTSLDYTVTINGEDYTGKTITFDSTQDYIIEYSCTDPHNYSFTSDGRIGKKDVIYTKTLKISVTEVASTAKDAVFTFYGYNSISKTASTTITDTKTATSNSGNTYIMPASTGSNITSTTIDGITVNCPVVYVDFKDNSSDFSWLYPLFLGVKIVDYTDGGSGDETTIVDPTTQNTKPNNLTIITTDKPSGSVGWSSGSGNSGSEGVLSSGTYKNLYGWTSGTIGSNKNADTIYGQFSYKDNKGTVYYYCIAFYRATHECPSCITPETLITLADGSQKEVQYLTGEEELLVWNLETGKYDTAPIVFVDSEEEEEYEVIHLYFSDGTDTEIIYEHGFFDTDLGEYVYIDAENAEQFIGHSFIKQDNINKNTWKTVKLTDVVLETKTTTPYSPVSFSHLCYYVDGMLSMPGGIDGLFNIFEVDTDIMAYDKVQKAKDIETYGLYTYEDFRELIPEIAFEAFNGAYLKVAIGKGILTWEDIEYLAERYIPLIPTN